MVQLPPQPPRSYNNLICDAGIQKASGSSGGAAPAPAAPIEVDGGSTLLEGLPDLGGLGAGLGLPDLGGLGQGQDWQKLMNAKAVVCDLLPTEVATCGSGVRPHMPLLLCLLLSGRLRQGGEGSLLGLLGMLSLRHPAEPEAGPN